MREFTSINENREFMFMYRRGKSFAADCIVIYFRKNNKSHIRLGITVTKKVGKAVVRNRVRRRIREAFSELCPGISRSCDIIIVARTKAAESSYSEIRSAMKYLMHKAELL